jgi:WD40 repeat protein
MRRLARAIVGTAAGRAAVMALALAGLWAAWAWGPLTPTTEWGLDAPASAGFGWLSPDGGSLAYAAEPVLPGHFLGPHGPLRVLDPGTGRERWRAIDPGVRGSVHRFAPDGTRVLTVDERAGLRAWDVATGRLLAALAPPGPSADLAVFRHVAWSPDGRRVAVARGLDPPVWVWDVSAGRLAAVLDAARPPLAFTPDGGTLVTATPGADVKLWDAATGRERGTLTGHPADIGAVAVSPDGRLVAAGLRHPPGQGEVDEITPTAVTLWDVTTGAAVATVPVTKHPEQMESLAFSPDGRLLVVCSGGGRGLIWDVTTTPPTNRDTLLGAAGNASSGQWLYCSWFLPQFSPDGAWWVFPGDRGGECAVLTPSGERQSVLRVGRGEWVRSAEFAPDGRTVALVTGTHPSPFGTWLAKATDWVSGRSTDPGRWRAVRLFDPATGRQLGRLPGAAGGYLLSDFSPDGQTLWTAHWIAGGTTGRGRTVIQGWDLRPSGPPLWLLAATALGLLAVAADVRRGRRGRGA